MNIPKSVSQFPKALKEAQSTKVTMSLSLVGAMAFGAYSMGKQASEPDPLLIRQAEQIQEIKITQERTTEILDRIEKRSAEDRKAIADVQTKQNNMTTRLEVISSYYRDGRDR